MKSKNKILWKIEELWKKYYIPAAASNISKFAHISENYENNISKFYPRFNVVSNFDFTASEKPVFIDDYGEYKGLQKCQLINPKKENDNEQGSLSFGKPVYLIDNHNEIVYPFVELCQATSRMFDVVHIDAHPDDAKFDGEKPAVLPLKNVGDFIKRTRISDFFDAVSQVRHSQHDGEFIKLIGTIFRVTHSDSFEFFLPPEQPYILSLDIDIFGPEGDFAELKDKVRAIALAWSGAEAVCIAMSPGFMDQEYAKQIIEIFKKP